MILIFVQTAASVPRSARRGRSQRVEASATDWPRWVAGGLRPAQNSLCNMLRSNSCADNRDGRRPSSRAPTFRSEWTIGSPRAEPKLAAGGLRPAPAQTRVPLILGFAGSIYLAPLRRSIRLALSLLSHGRSMQRAGELRSSSFIQARPSESRRRPRFSAHHPSGRKSGADKWSWRRNARRGSMV